MNTIDITPIHQPIAVIVLMFTNFSRVHDLGHHLVVNHRKNGQLELAETFTKGMGTVATEKYKKTGRCIAYLHVTIKYSI